MHNREDIFELENYACILLQSCIQFLKQYNMHSLLILESICFYQIPSFYFSNREHKPRLPNWI